MVPDPIVLPHWIVTVSGWSSAFATLVILCSVFMHLRNYRKPFQQRLMIRIQWIIPLFAISCYSMLTNPTSMLNKYIIEPTREIYEAFVIYTFFSLLINMLGGAKSIIIMTSGRPPVAHPGLFLYVLPDLDISDPKTFLNIKRGILQYVWLKPIICFGILFLELLGMYDVNDMSIRSLYLWFTIVYNISVSLSLYCLAIFWKILWNDLKPFNPVGKFLCVKLIIFASYWQGVILAILNFTGILPGNHSPDESGAPNTGVSIQNALLCVELVAFAIGHWLSFSYKPFTISKIPNGRLEFYYAFRDMIGIKDLVIDFRLTFYGDYYKDYKQFNSVDASIAHPSSNGRMGRINQGLRYHGDGKQKHWLLQSHSLSQHQAPSHLGSAHRSNIQSTSEQYAFQGSLSKPVPQTLYAASLGLNNTSTRGVYVSSPKLKASPESSIKTSEDMASLNIKSLPQDDDHERIDEIVRSINPDIDYDSEMFDDDERVYRMACSVINNYNLDQIEVKKLVNYPIVDELIMGHEYGYKVKKLRADRERLHQGSSADKTHTKYGSV
ncbi:Organic solute transporter Ostalpha [Metschnikowia aff. pulcherrima]|uniref:Organic solute transporter Ostalpha n=1 Tax=Metschnikowia aff. pulcherrima TaxID=2163413 RepID=A0A4P6XIR9_9ASCO|nr:Organic solute transporter Ostalpha [Metschnikowia aff. pulcherrima]